MSQRTNGNTAQLIEWALILIILILGSACSLLFFMWAGNGGQGIFPAQPKPTQPEEILASPTFDLEDTATFTATTIPTKRLTYTPAHGITGTPIPSLTRMPRTPSGNLKVTETKKPGSNATSTSSSGNGTDVNHTGTASALQTGSATAKTKTKTPKPPTVTPGGPSITPVTPDTLTPTDTEAPPTFTPSPTLTKTETPTGTLTPDTPTNTPTSTKTSTRTRTPTFTKTPSLTPSAPSPTLTITPSPTRTPTAISPACYGGSVTGFEAAHDTWLNKSSPDANYGGDETITVNPANSGGSRGIIQFDLSLIPRGSHVSKATLYLYEFTKNADQVIYILQITRSWKQSLATWNNPWDKPGGDVDTLDYVSFKPMRANCFIAIDVTYLARLWVSGEPNYGMMLYSTGPSGKINFASQENSVSGRRPMLDVEFTP
jgi:hypothetical protein